MSRIDELVAELCPDGVEYRKLGDVVDILDSDGYLFARGLVSAERDRVELAIGKTHSELAGNRILADLAETPLIHRDDMVVFE